MGKVQILIVDDDPQVRKLITDGLRLLGEDYEARCVASAEAAIDDMEQNTVDLLISDLRLPGLSGLDLIAYVRARRFQFPIILISGHPEVNLPAFQKTLGIDACLYKPMRLRDLLEQVRQCLKSAHPIQLASL